MKKGILVGIFIMFLSLVSCSKPSLYEEAYQKLNEFKTASIESNFLRTNTNAYHRVSGEGAYTLYNDALEVRKEPYFRAYENKDKEKSYIIQENDRIYNYTLTGPSYRADYLGDSTSYNREDNFILDFSFEEETSRMENSTFVFEMDYGVLTSSIFDLSAFKAIESFWSNQQMTLESSRVGLKISFDNYSYSAEFSFASETMTSYLSLNQSFREFEVIPPKEEIIYNSNSSYYEENQTVNVVLSSETPVILKYLLEAGDYYIGTMDGKVLSSKNVSIEIRDEENKVLEREIPLIHTNVIKTDYYFSIPKRGTYNLCLKGDTGEALTIRLFQYQYEGERPNKENSTEFQTEYNGAFRGNRDFIILKYQSSANEFLRFKLDGYLLYENDLGVAFAENDVLYVTEGVNYFYLFPNHYLSGSENLFKKQKVKFTIVESFEEKGLEPLEKLTNEGTKNSYWIGGNLKPKKFYLQLDKTSHLFFDLQYIYSNLYFDVWDLITIYNSSNEEVDKRSALPEGDYIVELSCPFYDSIFAVKPRVITIESGSLDYTIRLNKTSLAFDSEDFPYFLFVKMSEDQNNRYIFTLEERSTISLDGGVSIYSMEGKLIEKVSYATSLRLEAGQYYITVDEPSLELIRFKMAIIN